MAVVEIELVVAHSMEGELSGNQTSAVANTLAEIFGTGPNRTWVRFRYLPSNHYAQNGTYDESRELPVFIRILKNRPPQKEEMAEQMIAIARRLAPIIGRPAEFIHILYEPTARGRFGVGGVLS
jgi:phenylpyruvate tautomerase PptA (4-oxalocrotonate tautomerase family)